MTGERVLSLPNGVEMYYADVCVCACAIEYKIFHTLHTSLRNLNNDQTVKTSKTRSVTFCSRKIALMTARNATILVSIRRRDRGIIACIGHTTRDIHVRIQASENKSENKQL